MKYRISQKGYTFYPEWSNWGIIYSRFWDDEKHEYVKCSSLNEAKNKIDHFKLKQYHLKEIIHPY